MSEYVFAEQHPILTAVVLIVAIIGTLGFYVLALIFLLIMFLAVTGGKKNE